ncbi:MAG: FeoB-associated Cys-rich membrane protein [Bacteroidaceae bacterium]|nr:FeoB-associated Cys-rich membrane protein [Bacteroidaceae bacterium]
MQEIIVYIIIACAAIAIIRHFYRQFKSRNKCCNSCDSCPMQKGNNCHCHDVQK